MIWTELVAAEDEDEDDDDLELEYSGNARHIPGREMNKAAKKNKKKNRDGTPRSRSPMATTARKRESNARRKQTVERKCVCVSF